MIVWLAFVATRLVSIFMTHANTVPTALNTTGMKRPIAHRKTEFDFITDIYNLGFLLNPCSID